MRTFICLLITGDSCCCKVVICVLITVLLAGVQPTPIQVCGFAVFFGTYMYLSIYILTTPAPSCTLIVWQGQEKGPGSIVWWKHKKPCVRGFDKKTTCAYVNKSSRTEQCLGEPFAGDFKSAYLEQLVRAVEFTLFVWPSHKRQFTSPGPPYCSTYRECGAGRDIMEGMQELSILTSNHNYPSVQETFCALVRLWRWETKKGIAGKRRKPESEWLVWTNRLGIKALLLSLLALYKGRCNSLNNFPMVLSSYSVIAYLIRRVVPILWYII